MLGLMFAPFLALLLLARIQLALELLASMQSALTLLALALLALIPRAPIRLVMTRAVVIGSVLLLSVSTTLRLLPPVVVPLRGL